MYSVLVLYLSLLNRSLSASNMCLMLRPRAWAVYHSCNFWKLGSWVSPMLSREGGLLCSTVLNYLGWVRLSRSERELFEGHSLDLNLPLLQETYNIHDLSVSHLPTVLQGLSACSSLCHTDHHTGQTMCCTFSYFSLKWLYSSQIAKNGHSLK